MIGVDISPAMIDEARRLVPDGDFRVGTLRELPLESRSIDVVIASSVLHHVPDSVLLISLTRRPRACSPSTARLSVASRPACGGSRIQGGWLSGAVMAFRHLVCRLTNTREIRRTGDRRLPPRLRSQRVHEDRGGCLDAHRVQVRGIRSAFMGRSTHPAVVKLALWFDDWMDHQGGQEFYTTPRPGTSTTPVMSRTV